VYNIIFKLSLLSLLFACSSSGELYKEGLLCTADDQCAWGEICFRGGCVWQGEPGERAPPAEPSAPEEEQAPQFEIPPPLASEEYLWILGPEFDALIQIDSESLEVEQRELGDEPIQMALRGEEAVILHGSSDELAILRGDDLSFLPLGGHFNALSLSGEHALCWLDSTRLRPGEEASSFQEVVLVDLDQKTLERITVGYGPEQIIFTTHEILVVTGDGLSVIPLAEPEPIAEPQPLALDPLSIKAREVVVSRDGSFVASRAAGEEGISLLNRSADQLHFIDLGAEPSDLDLLPDDRRLLVMLRSAQRLALISMESPDEPIFLEFPEDLLGSAAVGAELAVLFSTDPQAETFALLDLEAQRMIFRPARRPISSVELDPTGRAALLWHPMGEGPQALGGYSLLRLSDGYTRLQLSSLSPRGLAFGAGQSLILLGDETRGLGEAQLVNLESFRVQSYAMGSLPETGGLIGTRAFVSQRHSEGRISFIDPNATPPVQTLSGFALNGRIQ